jgi:putative ABC transport system permease protein
MKNLSVAWRNVRRNKRRTLVTLMTIAVGTLALLLLGGLMSYVVLEFQTSTVRRLGHLAVYKTGYFQYGAGNPSAYGIPDYSSVLDLIRDDPAIRPYLEVATPAQIVQGVAGNYSANTSKTFFGQGIIPADRVRMREWNEHHLSGIELSAGQLQRPDGAVVGAGLGRILRLCVPGPAASACAPDAPASGPADGGPANTKAADLAELQEREVGSGAAAASAELPTIDLLAATAGGAPNVVSVEVERADAYGFKDIDDNFIVMQLPVAQQLVYGRGEPHVTALNLQLHRTEDVPVVRVALVSLFKAKGLDLEVRDYAELDSMYTQTQAFFSFLFGFIALVIMVIVVFTVINTMGMSVMERVGEIGTARALGVQRRGIRNLFFTEGALQGFIGATLGVLLAVLVVFLVNHANIKWSPPTSAGLMPFKLFLFGNILLMGGVWGLLTVIAAMASLLPAHKASRLQIVDALRHV